LAIPLSIAGELAAGRWVWVGPPFDASAPRAGSMPNRLEPAGVSVISACCGSRVALPDSTRLKPTSNPSVNSPEPRSSPTSAVLLAMIVDGDDRRWEDHRPVGLVVAAAVVVLVEVDAAAGVVVVGVQPGDVVDDGRVADRRRLVLIDVGEVDPASFVVSLVARDGRVLEEDVAVDAAAEGDPAAVQPGVAGDRAAADRRVGVVVAEEAKAAATALFGGVAGDRRPLDQHVAIKAIGDDRTAPV
jgi:hypothetical protein